MSLFEELKRRNVIRIAILYMVSSWVLLQLADVLTSLLNAPESAGTIVVMLLILGFFPALIFAWVYEMTPDGLKRESDVDRSQSETPATGKKINTVIIVLLVVAIGGLIADRLVPETSVTEDPILAESREAPIDDLSIAVLPFADLSPAGDQEYFTDGLSEELLNLLVRVDDLHVASRTSSFAYRGSTLSIPEISKALRVGHILEGSVRKDGDRIRITAQLIEADTDRHLWSENFDRELVDIFAIQDEIANAIVEALTGKLGVGAERTISVEAATENVDAYEMYLTARELFLRRAELPESIRLFRRAIELDPSFARAWEGLAAVEAVGNDWIPDGIDHYPLAREAAEKALALNPDLSMPLAVLGALATEADHDFLRGIEYFDAALEKDPKNTTAWLWLGIRQNSAGFFAEAIESLRNCLSIDPGYLNCRQHLAHTYLVMGDPDTALKLNDVAMENVFDSISEAFIPEYVRRGHRNLAIRIADNRLGSIGAPAIEIIRAVENPGGDNSAGYARLKDWENRTRSGVTIAQAIPYSWVYFGVWDEIADNPATYTYMYWHPDGDEFRKTDVAKVAMRESGILAYWQARGFPPQCKPVGDDDFECVVAKTPRQRARNQVN
ncbi:MAG: tetratricopeptide repeat protein [Gammaproteobacteria bacterium]|nr:tetratricopeptide repeat protein [Gammaproteobacteria bacterium]